MSGYYDYVDSDLSTLSSSSRSSGTSTTSDDDSGKRSDDEPEFVGSGFDIISKSNLLQFLQGIDPKAFLDDQTTNLLARIADVFAHDVCTQIVKLSHMRKEKPVIRDLEFILKREYNMEFPKRPKKEEEKVKT